MTCDPRAGSDNILAGDDGTLQRLTLAPTATGTGAMPMNADGVPIDPWEVELWRWPPEAEPALRRSDCPRGGPPDLELWCNCAD